MFDNREIVRCVKRRKVIGNDYVVTEEYSRLITIKKPKYLYIFYKFYLFSFHLLRLVRSLHGT